MKKFLLSILLMLPLTTTLLTAAPLKIDTKDSIKTVLKAHQKVRVIIKMKSGGELTGEVGLVNDNIDHIKTLAGMEFFDAVVLISNIEAILIRTKG